MIYPSWSVTVLSLGGLRRLAFAVYAWDFSLHNSVVLPSRRCSHRPAGRARGAVVVLGASTPLRTVDQISGAHAIDAMHYGLSKS